MPTPDDKRVDLVEQVRGDLKDTDGDGATDAEERRAGTDPNDAYDTPVDFDQLPDSGERQAREAPTEPASPEPANKGFWEDHFDHENNPDGSVTITQKNQYEGVDADLQLAGSANPFEIQDLRALDNNVSVHRASDSYESQDLYIDHDGILPMAHGWEDDTSNIIVPIQHSQTQGPEITPDGILPMAHGWDGDDAGITTDATNFGREDVEGEDVPVQDTEVFDIAEPDSVVQEYEAPEYPIQDFPVQDLLVQDFPVQDFQMQDFPVEDYQLQNVQILDFATAPEGVLPEAHGWEGDGADGDVQV